MPTENIYGSGLNFEDWHALNKILNTYAHAGHLELLRLGLSYDLNHAPPHLASHDLVSYLRRYVRTHNKTWLDRAGQQLVPGTKNFSWYVVMTKM